VFQVESRFGGGHFCRVVVVQDGADVTTRGVLYPLLHYALCVLFDPCHSGHNALCQWMLSLHFTATDMLVTSD